MADDKKRERSPEREPDEIDDDPNADDIAAEDDPLAGGDPPASGTVTADDAAAEEQKRTEATARRMGWVPQDEFRGRPETWKSADEFVNDGRENGRVLLERIDTIGQRLERSEAENRDLKMRVDESGQVLRSLNDRFLNADRIGFERGKRAAEERMRQAAQEADTEAYDAAKAERDAYDKAPQPEAPRREAPARTEPAVPARPTVDPVTNAWVQENQWFQDDELSDFTIAAHRRLLAKNPRYNTPIGQIEGLNAARAETMKRYPERFENERRAAPGSTRSGGGDRMNGSRPGKKTVADLPADARVELARNKRTIKGYTDEEYLAVYFEDQA